MKARVRPSFHRVLIRPLTRDTSRGGIIIPDTANEKDEPTKGQVIAVGDGTRPPHYQRIPMSVKAGDTVLFRKHAGRHVDMDVGKGTEALRFIAEEDIDAVIEGNPDGVEVAS